MAMYLEQVARLAPSVQGIRAMRGEGRSLRGINAGGD
jgi:hypothetical protein